MGCQTVAGCKEYAGSFINEDYWQVAVNVDTNEKQPQPAESKKPTTAEDNPYQNRRNLSDFVSLVGFITGCFDRDVPIRLVGVRVGQLLVRLPSQVKPSARLPSDGSVAAVRT